MSFKKNNYPPNWQALRAEVLRLAEDRCQCTGECGSDHRVDGIPGKRCDIPNHARIVRDSVTPAHWWEERDAPRHHLGDDCKVVTCRLTIAHLCHESTCDNLEHLRAMCQRCHLVYDATQHAAHAMQTRWQQRDAAGQMRLCLLAAEGPPPASPPMRGKESP